MRMQSQANSEEVGSIISISYSRYSSYLKCPYQHYLRYIEGLSQKRPQKPLFFGSDFHKLLEFRNDPKGLRKAKKEIEDKYYEIPSKWQSDLGENYLENLDLIFEDYNEVYANVPQPHITEKPFEIPIGRYQGETVNFKGVIDELYLYKHKGEKLIKVGEHKTFSRAPSMSTLIMNTQKCLYAKATQLERGILPRAVIWDYIKSTPASSPTWLEKSQRFSNAKSTKITQLSWKRACEERGITDESIILQGEQYKPNITEFFFRAELELVPNMVEVVWDNFIYGCKDIAKNGARNKIKNFTRDCEYCGFKDVCYTECTNGNRKYLIDKNYTYNDHKGGK